MRNGKTRIDSSVIMLVTPSDVECSGRAFSVRVVRGWSALSRGGYTFKDVCQQRKRYKNQDRHGLDLLCGVSATEKEVNLRFLYLHGFEQV